MKALSAAIFSWHQPDIDSLRKELQGQVRAGKLTDRQLRQKMSNTRFLSANCRRTIPDAAELKTRLQDAYDTFEKKVSVEHGRLFTAETKNVHDRTLLLVADGYLSGGLLCCLNSCKCLQVCCWTPTAVVTFFDGMLLLLQTLHHPETSIIA